MNFDCDLFLPVQAPLTAPNGWEESSNLNSLILTSPGAGEMKSLPTCLYVIMLSFLEVCENVAQMICGAMKTAE